ncbi:MAG: tetratricopeptide repeat protein [Armatimonadia bacterium]
MRPLWALLGLLTLLVLWLGLVLVQERGDVPSALTTIARSAERSGLPGLAANCHLLTADCYRRRLGQMDHRKAEAQPLLRAIARSRMAAARQLMQAGNTAGAEGIALEGARADFDDVEARILLLETRLQGTQTDAARRELMLLLLRQEHPQALYLLGRSFEAEQRLDDAESFFRRALQIDPRHLASILGLSEVHIARRDRPGALALLGQASTLSLSAKEKREVARVRQQADPSLTSRFEMPLYWCSQHYGSVVFGLIYVLFLFTPLWLSLLRERSQPCRAH